MLFANAIATLCNGSDVEQTKTTIKVLVGMKATESGKPSAIFASFRLDGVIQSMPEIRKGLHELKKLVTVRIPTQDIGRAVSIGIAPIVSGVKLWESIVTLENRIRSGLNVQLLDSATGLEVVPEIHGPTMAELSV